jgi:hypothetical protein
MAWKIHPAGSWGIATTDTPAQMAAVLALPGSWPIGQQPSCFVRKDQWLNLAAGPEVDSITPSGGPAAGGTGVTISGSGLVGSTGVTIGGNPATGFLVNSDATITCIAPAHAAGTVNVVVQNPRGNVTTPAAFTYS